MSIRARDPVVSADPTISIKDIFAEVAITTKTEEDPLLLSCVLYRLNNEDPNGLNGSFAHDLTGPLVKEQITDEDRIFAGTVRRHYNDKIVLTTLRGDRITPFRQDLARFLSGEFKKTGENHEFPIKFLGMLYKLPYFYHYDKELQPVFDGEYHSLKGDVLNYETEQQKLTFIKKIMSYRKGRNPHEYWFSDHKDDRFMLSVEARSPLADLFDHYLTSNNNIAVKGYFRAARKDTLEYYRANTWTLII
jgi:hypothetical protein